MVRSLIQQTILLGLGCFVVSEGQEQIKVMTLNTWNCGSPSNMNDGKAKLTREINETDADIVFLQEATTQCANQLLADTAAGMDKYTQCSNTPGYRSTATLFKKDKFEEVEIADLPSAILFKKEDTRYHFCKVRSKAASEALISLINLNWENLNYGPEMVCETGRVFTTWPKHDDIVYFEFIRRADKLAELLDRFETIGGFVDTVVILGADMNAPATVDYQAGTAERHCGLENFTWPTSEELDSHDMLDAYRVVNPDVFEFPGITYSPVYNGSTDLVGRGITVKYPQDRRDFIYYRPSSTLKVTATRAWTYYRAPIEHHARQFYTYGDTPIGSPQVKDNSWPSDHAAVIAELEMEAL